MPRRKCDNFFLKVYRGARKASLWKWHQNRKCNGWVILAKIRGVVGISGRRNNICKNSKARDCDAFGGSKSSENEAQHWGVNWWTGSEWWGTKPEMEAGSSWMGKGITCNPECQGELSAIPGWCVRCAVCVLLKWSWQKHGDLIDRATGDEVRPVRTLREESGERQGLDEGTSHSDKEVKTQSKLLTKRGGRQNFLLLRWGQEEKGWRSPEKLLYFYCSNWVGGDAIHLTRENVKRSRFEENTFGFRKSWDLCACGTDTTDTSSKEGNIWVDTRGGMKMRECLGSRWSLQFAVMKAGKIHKEEKKGQNMKNVDHKGIGRRKNKNTPFKKRTAPEMGGAEFRRLL